jgi:hypothetical protein
MAKRGPSGPRPSGFWNRTRIAENVVERRGILAKRGPSGPRPSGFWNRTRIAENVVERRGIKRFLDFNQDS